MCSSGFTLLELLLSMGITAVIIVIVFGAFRVGLRAWEKGERTAERQQRIRVVAQLVRSQLGSVNAFNTMQAQGKSVTFAGSERQLSFFSAIALVPDHRHGVVFSQLTVESDSDGDSLFLVEILPAAADGVIDTDSIDATERVSLLENATSIQFTYLQHVPADGEWRWQSEWLPAENTGLPVAVNLQIDDPAFAAPLSLLIPLRGRGAAS
jgi:general secretion pathway protein J